MNNIIRRDFTWLVYEEAFEHNSDRSFGVGIAHFTTQTLKLILRKLTIETVELDFVVSFIEVLLTKWVILFENEPRLENPR